MPSNTTLHRQRTLGGLVGIVVLAFGLGYHFFPRLFHAAARFSQSLRPARNPGSRILKTRWRPCSDARSRLREPGAPPA